MYNLVKIKCVIERLDEECSILAEEFGRSINSQFVADRIYEFKRKPGGSRKTAWSQFLHKKLEGKAPLRKEELDEVFEGYRRVIQDLTSGVYEGQRLQSAESTRVGEIEGKILNEFGLSHLGVCLEAGMFLAPAYHSDNRTPALAVHDPDHMRTFADLIKAKAKSMEGVNLFMDLCSEYGAEIVHARPESADLSKVRVLADSIVYDNTDWVPVPSKEELQSVPVQPCYSTRVLRLVCDDPTIKTISFELNTNGLGVIPVPSRDQSAPMYRFMVQEDVCMTESPSPTRTTYVEYLLNPECVGQEQIFVIYSIFFNGLQDSILPTGEADEPSEIEWLGKRVSSKTEDADMAVILPSSLAVQSWRFNRRPESQQRDEVMEVDDRERILESSMQRAGSMLEGVKAIWKIPQVNEPTIFSFQWCWD